MVFTHFVLHNILRIGIEIKYPNMIFSGQKSSFSVKISFLASNSQSTTQKCIFFKKKNFSLTDTQNRFI